MEDVENIQSVENMSLAVQEGLELVYTDVLDGNAYEPHTVFHKLKYFIQQHLPELSEIPLKKEKNIRGLEQTKNENLGVNSAFHRIVSIDTVLGSGSFGIVFGAVVEFSNNEGVKRYNPVALKIAEDEKCDACSQMRYLEKMSIFCGGDYDFYDVRLYEIYLAENYENADNNNVGCQVMRMYESVKNRIVTTGEEMSCLTESYRNLAKTIEVLQKHKLCHNDVSLSNIALLREGDREFIVLLDYGFCGERERYYKGGCRSHIQNFFFKSSDKTSMLFGKTRHFYDPQQTNHNLDAQSFVVLVESAILGIEEAPRYRVNEWLGLGDFTTRPIWLAFFVLSVTGPGDDIRIKEYYHLSLGDWKIFYEWKACLDSFHQNLESIYQLVRQEYPDMDYETFTKQQTVLTMENVKKWYRPGLTPANVLTRLRENFYSQLNNVVEENLQRVLLRDSVLVYSGKSEKYSEKIYNSEKQETKQETRGDLRGGGFYDSELGYRKTSKRLNPVMCGKIDYKITKIPKINKIPKESKLESEIESEL